MKYRKIITSASTVAAAAALTLGFSGAAYAGDDARACNNIISGSGACAAETYFDAVDSRWGERIITKDGAPDGRAAKSYLYYYDTNGNQVIKSWVCATGSGTSCFNYVQIPEGTRVAVQACLQKDGRELGCGPSGLRSSLGAHAEAAALTR